MTGLPFRQNIDRALTSAIGMHGVQDTAFQKTVSRLDPALIQLREAYEKKTLELLRLPERTHDIFAMQALAARLKDSSDIVFLGTGGSSLGGQTLAQLAGYDVPGVGIWRAAPRVHFLANLDPRSLQEFLARLPLKTTRFAAISKSGGTAETLLQTIAAISAMKAAGMTGEIGKRFFGISEPAKTGGKNGLRALLENFGCEFLDHDTGVGGRFSVLTNVGLLPAILLGLDVRAIRAGAAESLQPLLSAAKAAEVPAALGAALNVAASEAGRPIAVMMAYADRLDRFTRWWVQLWAESLGKQGKGTTPVAANGPVDQHSQLQLWLDGPRDKLFTVLTTEVARVGPHIDPALAEMAGEKDLGGKTIGDLVAAQGRATIDTFAKNGRPVRSFEIDKLDARALGALLMHFMLETVLAASLLGVDPYDQPAVEEGKVLAKRYLSRAR